MVGDKQKITETGSFFGDFFLIDRQKSPEALPLFEACLRCWLFS